MLWLSYYCLCLLFNKIEEKDRIASAWKRGGWGEREERERGRDGPNIHAHMNK
jgi:hypothetical protein